MNTSENSQMDLTASGPGRSAFTSRLAVITKRTGSSPSCERSGTAPPSPDAWPTISTTRHGTYCLNSADC